MSEMKRGDGPLVCPKCASLLASRTDQRSVPTLRAGCPILGHSSPTFHRVPCFSVAQAEVFSYNPFFLFHELRPIELSEACHRANQSERPARAFE